MAVIGIGMDSVAFICCLKGVELLEYRDSNRTVFVIFVLLTLLGEGVANLYVLTDCSVHTGD